ncbi:guanylate cyclase soluble subunit alpha-2-like [Lytechinus variegatus]|uniref:guanylate cyclase soluble subunit alpha-2-like n=1 Tax=Lytechinus variegatus TaxID=7654 RepID=UPI001BB13260|nr:guanylate cyclase soluble subunit alpha-2-like [Lytechinus variegatus]
MACPMGFSSPPPPPSAARDHDSSPTGKSSSSSHSPTSPEPSPHRSGSTTSCTALGEENECNGAGAKRKLDLKGLCQGLASIVFPSVGIVSLTFRRVFSTFGQDDIIDDFLDNEGLDSKFSTESLANYYDSRPNSCLEDLLIHVTTKGAKILGLEYTVFMERFGEEFFCLCFEQYGTFLQALGGSLVEFYSNIDGLQQHIASLKLTNNHRPPSFRCSTRDDERHILLHMYTESTCISQSMAGQIKMASILLFNSFVDVQMGERVGNHSVYIIQPLLDEVHPSCDKNRLGHPIQSISTLSTRRKDAKLSVNTFSSAFPFHVMFNRQLLIKQLGDTIVRMMAQALAADGLNFNSYFKVLSPPMERVTFENILANINLCYVIATTCVLSGLSSTESKYSSIEVTGQMIYVPESDCILFLGSPRVGKLEELTGRGLYLADIPIHDATRDLILVGEESRAQDGLKKRMDKLKSQVEEASGNLDSERQKNVDLLNLIFPEAVAKKLWRGEPVPAQTIEGVSMLFSDIVGFTAICSTATPFMVVNMLNSLYTEFDSFCGILDVYKVETIGDAYCVASGLHKSSNTHAQLAAKMAIKMMEAAAAVKSHQGNALRMRIGLHTGEIVAGIVGQKMPRYCLFGNNVTLANKMESHSEALKINVSPTTHVLLAETGVYHFEERARDTLPAAFPANIPGNPYFLYGYDTNPDDPVDVELFGDKKHVEIPT